MKDNDQSPFGEVIYSYTRAQAIADGILIDVTPMALQAGIKFPVAVTCGVWGRCVKVPDGVTAQDQSGRLWDVLWMFSLAARGSAGRRCDFQLYVRNHNRPNLTRCDLVSLYAMIGPGDTADPVITIMLPDED